MRLLLTGMLVVLMAGCATTRTVAVPEPVAVPGPVRYLPIPAELLTCDDAGPPPAKGAPLGDLFAWAQRAAAASSACQAKLERARELARTPD